MTSHIKQQESGLQGHLPECLHDWPDLPVCICDELRACEQRVRLEERARIAVERTTLAELNAEWRKGVQAARDAVAALPLVGCFVEELAIIRQPLALAAIDALRSTNTDTGITSTNEDT